MNKPGQIQPEKMDLQSIDIAAEKREELKRSLKGAFPEVFAEGKVDFDQLKRVLGDWVDPSKERFGLNWPGKAECMKIVQQSSVAALKPAASESVDFEGSENLFIEGDNLEVLKLLQKAYFGKVKLVFIDPPYNTGNEFIYPDKYSETLDTYLAYSGQVDDQGKRFSTNTELAGRYHSRWLSMIYPRLYLARNLLTEDGSIFITIDDNEAANLQKVCDEIFGEENFRALISWQKKYSVSNNFKGIASIRDFVLVYSKSDRFQNGLLPRTQESIDRYINPDDDERGPWKPVDYWNVASVEDRPNLVYPITNPHTGKVINPSVKAWKFAREVHATHVEENRIWWGKNGTNEVPALKLFLSDVKDGLIPHNWWPHEEAGHTDKAKKQLDELFGGVAPFDTPKPVQLLRKILQVANVGSDDIVLDFFAGSCATGHAVMENNEELGWNTKFVMVQLPEPTDAESQAFKSGYKNIAQIGRERLKRAGAKLVEARKSELEFRPNHSTDVGFRAFKLSRSNFALWESDPEHFDEGGSQLQMHVDHLAADSSDEAILFELLTKAGFKPTTKIERVQMAAKTVFSVEEGTLLICLDKDITPELIDALAEADPLQVICLDEGFKGNDQLKTNAVQTFKARAQAEESEIVFKTV